MVGPSMTSAALVPATRDRLGRVGVWIGGMLAVDAEHERAAAGRIEALGYGSLFTGEVVGGKEAFAHQGLLLASTERMVIGTGIANVWARHPATMAGGAATLGDAYPGRFILGIGVSHAPVVEHSGQRYDKPIGHMAGYLDAMDASVGMVPRPALPVPRLLAALRPRMLALSRDRSDGAHPYFVPVSHTPIARGILGPDKLLIPEQAVVLSSHPDQARSISRRYMARYLELPNYVNNLMTLGYTDDDLSDGGSDRLVDAIVARGDEAAIARRVQEHLDGGADHVVIQPLGPLDAVLDQLDELAPALLHD